METKKIHDLIEQLENELDRTQSIGADERDSLRKLTEDIREHLTRPEGEQRDHVDSLIEQISDAIQDFEVSHPELTWTLGKVLNILSQSGI